MAFSPETEGEEELSYNLSQILKPPQLKYTHTQTQTSRLELIKKQESSVSGWRWCKKERSPMNDRNRYSIYANNLALEIVKMNKICLKKSQPIWTRK